MIPFPSSSSSGGWPASAAPLLPRLALEPTLSRSGLFDGAWWPRSNNACVELPDLLTALAAHLGQVVRVSLDTSAWRAVPRYVDANGLTVPVSWPASSSHTLSIARGSQDEFLLLVIPSDTDPRTAAAVMARASSAGNRTPATELLAGAVPPDTPARA
ncbi:DUF5994 family protein [Kitasatospora sp. DSM 101779]|uniref:DUF5994 family protein n=1 Tax=Kitasatospora sp. DSM 101779 TaxID=2853165 RepID=UPI0021DADAB5|nr:DUF5994 family protein [Kitasatospora sp. DSM 101779]MCU7820985.1 hypothetical protein [Kitasatospora sp. DSM 101779]